MANISEHFWGESTDNISIGGHGFFKRPWMALDFRTSRHLREFNLPLDNLHAMY